MRYVRFESPVANGRGAHVGIFGLANGLARTGRLTPADRLRWRAANDWFTAAYPDPGRTHPDLFDRARHPPTSCWFDATAAHLLERVPDYVALLDRYGVAWVERRSDAPGRVLYEDAVQIVVEPHRP